MHAFLSAFNLVLFLSFSKNLSVTSGGFCSVVQPVNSKRNSGNHNEKKGDSCTEMATPSFAVSSEKAFCIALYLVLFPTG